MSQSMNERPVASDEASAAVEEENESEDDVTLRELLESGVDVRDYSAKLEKGTKEAHSSAVRQCIEKAEEMAQLHDQIQSCDQLLGNLETQLSLYLEDLALINVDMQKLKEQSVVLSQQLHNRQMVSAELSQFVDDLVVPHIMIKTIAEGDANDPAFLEQLHELQHKLQFIKAQEFKEAKAVGDVHDVIENLKYKATEKVREWLLLKTNLFKKPLTNYQIPQNALLKSRFFYEFLLANDRQVAKEVRDEYVDTISKMLFSYFKAYASRLFKLQMKDSATKEDMLGTEDGPNTAKQGTMIGGFFTSKGQTRSKATVFSLGQRDKLLGEDLMSPLIVPHVAQQGNESFQFEAIFRSIHFAFVDHCSHEYLFCADFFLVSGDAAVDMFNQVIGRSMIHLQKTMSERIATNFDAISLWLCIGICQRYEQLMVDRAVAHAAGNYWETMRQMLWQRLEFLMQAHSESLRSLDVRHLQAPVDTRPHHVIRRYAEFTAAFLVAGRQWSNDAPVDPQLQALLSKQQVEVEGLLNRFASQLKGKKERLVFQINNYDVILTVLDGKVAYQSKERSSFWELQQTKINAYVEEVLAPHFSQMIQFVHETEPLIEQSHTQLLARYRAKRTQIVRSFSAEWKRSIEAVNNEIVQSFTNFKNGTNILQTAFSQFLHYYQRLAAVLSHEAFTKGDGPMQQQEQLVSYHHLTAELKKYKPMF